MAKDLVLTIGATWATLIRVGAAATVTGATIRPRVQTFTRRKWHAVAMLGVSMIWMNLSLYHAIGHLPLGIAVGIEFCGPLAVAVAHSRRPTDLARVAAATAGIFLLTPLTGSELNPVGVAWALSAAAGWAGYILASDHAGRATDGLEAVPVALALGAALVCVPALAEGTAAIDAAAIGAGVAVGLLSSAIPYTLELEALRRIPTGTFGLMMSLEPLVAVAAGWIVLGEVISGRQWLAIILILTANLGAAGGDVAEI